MGWLKYEHERSTAPRDKRIHLILDGAAYHRSNAVKDKAKELNIELHYLPHYSQNFNPIERF